MRSFCFTVVLCALVACAGPAPRKVFAPSDNAPTVTPKTLAQLASLPDPAVIAEPKSRGGNREVYTVLGKSYRVMDSAKGFKQTGVASWYGTKFHGRQTANGERFDIYKLTAAHPHLPIPTFVRVTNLDNRRQTIVRVNDRGPFHSGRIIDLSYAAAVKLGFHDEGTARVRVEVVEPVTEQRRFMVQAGAFSGLPAADRARRELANLTGLPTVVVRQGGDGLYRVRLGPVAEGKRLQRTTSILQSSKYGQPRLIPVP